MNILYNMKDGFIGTIEVFALFAGFVAAVAASAIAVALLVKLAGYLWGLGLELRDMWDETKREVEQEEREHD